MKIVPNSQRDSAILGMMLPDFFQGYSNILQRWVEGMCDFTLAHKEYGVLGSDSPLMEQPPEKARNISMTHQPADVAGFLLNQTDL